MANLRNLKKEVRYVCGDLAAECLLAKTFINGADKKILTEAVRQIAHLQESALDKVHFSFDHKPGDFATSRAFTAARSAYYHKAYRSFREKFYAQVNEIVHLMNTSLPKPAKEATSELK